MPFDFVPFKNLSFPQGAYQNGSAQVIYNLAPVEGYGYVPFGANSGEEISTTQLDTAARGGTTFRVGTADYIFVGTTGRLYHLPVATGVLTNVSQGGGTPYTTSGTDWGWSFSRWGNGLAATNFIDHVQYKADITNTTAFIDAFTSTTKPKAKFIGLVKNQFFVAHTNEGGTTYPQRVRWGAVDNLFDMEPSPTTQADYQDILDDCGEITGFVGGEYGLVFKERAIYKATYVGPPVIYRFDQIASGLGTRSPGSVIEYKGSVYFWGANGIYRVLPGGAGVDRVPEGIFKQLALGDPFSFPSQPWPRSVSYDKQKPYLVHSVVDPALGCVYWGFPTSSISGRSFIVAVCVEDGRTSICDAQSAGGTYMQWIIPGSFTGQEFTGYAPSGYVSGAYPRTAYGINSTRRVATHRSEPQVLPQVCSGILSEQLGRRFVITRVRPAFFSSGSFNASATMLSPATAVEIHEHDSTGMVVATNTFTAEPSANGWYAGKANGQYLSISTKFGATGIGGTPSAFVAVAAGWEVEYDESGSER